MRYGFSRVEQDCEDGVPAGSGLVNQHSECRRQKSTSGSDRGDRRRKDSALSTVELLQAQASVDRGGSARDLEPSQRPSKSAQSGSRRLSQVEVTCSTSWARIAPLRQAGRSARRNLGERGAGAVGVYLAWLL
ncbi:MAG: hypothetical protein Q9159_004574 [Coniocarpon cinnabarinum]